MGSRRLWWPALPLAVGGWLSARWVAHLLSASNAHEAGGYGVLHLCGACVLMLVLLVVVIVGRPVLRLGLEHGVQLVPVRAPRPRLARPGPLRLVMAQPSPSRPSVLGRGRAVRAPPAAPAPV
jgi:hypothetical protein